MSEARGWGWGHSQPHGSLSSLRLPSRSLASPPGQAEPARVPCRATGFCLTRLTAPPRVARPVSEPLSPEEPRGPGREAGEGLSMSASPRWARPCALGRHWLCSLCALEGRTGRGPAWGLGLWGDSGERQGRSRLSRPSGPSGRAAAQAKCAACPAPAPAPLSLGGWGGRGRRPSSTLTAPGRSAEESIHQGPEPLGGPLTGVGATLCGGAGSAHTAHPGAPQPRSVRRK